MKIEDILVPKPYMAERGRLQNAALVAESVATGAGLTRGGVKANICKDAQMLNLAVI